MRKTCHVLKFQPRNPQRPRGHHTHRVGQQEGSLRMEPAFLGHIAYQFPTCQEHPPGHENHSVRSHLVAIAGWCSTRPSSMRSAPVALATTRTAAVSRTPKVCKGTQLIEGRADVVGQTGHINREIGAHLKQVLLQGPWTTTRVGIGNMIAAGATEAMRPTETRAATYINRGVAAITATCANTWDLTASAARAITVCLTVTGSTICND